MLTGNCFLCVKLTALEEADLVSEAYPQRPVPLFRELQRGPDVSENSKDLGFRPSLLTQELSPQQVAPLL